MVAEYLGIKMGQHDVRLCLNGLRLTFHRFAKQLLGFRVVVFRVVLYAFGQLVITSVGGVISQHIENKAFFYGLLHTVKVERMEFAILTFRSKPFECFFFGRGCKCKIGAVGAHFAVFHQLLQQFVCVDSFTIFVFLNGLVGTVGGYARLRAVCFINNDGKIPVTHIGNGITDVWKLLYGCDNDALTLLDGFFEHFRRIGMGDDFFTLPECFDIVGYLLVEQATVCHDDHRIIQFPIKRFGAECIHCGRTNINQLECKPSK